MTTTLKATGRRMYVNRSAVDVVISGGAGGSVLWLRGGGGDNFIEVAESPDQVVTVLQCAEQRTELREEYE